MKTLAEHMAAYGAYHRDPRNRLTHFFGVPLIVFALLVLLGLARAEVGGVEASAGMAFAAVVLAYYVRLDAPLGLAVAALVLPLLWAADAVARLGAGTALAVFAAAFVGGWALQLLGHRFEGNRPALLDNLFQALVAPIFLVAEAAFALGLRADLRAEVARRAGAD